MDDVAADRGALFEAVIFLNHFVTTQVGSLGSGDLEFRDQTIGPTGQCL
jgi:hypothetical protein